MTLSLPEIDEITASMGAESKALKEELMFFCWGMRGSLSVTEAYNLDREDRELIAKLISSNMEIAKKTGVPYF